MMNEMDKSVQHRSVLAVPVTVQQDTPKGTFVNAQGLLVADGMSLPLGVTQYEAKAGEMVAVTVIGTASVDMTALQNASNQVLSGDFVVFIYGDGFGVISANGLEAMLSNSTAVLVGVVLYDAAATGHAEVLLK